MMTTQHTSGPWHVDGSAIRTNPENHYTDSTWICQAVLTDANARLIAAAPDLLAALRDLCGVCRDLSVDPADFARKLEAAEAAIAKAVQS